MRISDWSSDVCSSDLYADEPTDADMPLPRAAELATEMAVRTFFDLFRDTRLEGIADRIAWGIVHSFHKVADQLDAEADKAALKVKDLIRSEEHTSELQSLMRISYAVFCLKKKNTALNKDAPYTRQRTNIIKTTRHSKKQQHK